jgi:hypothetical protein
MGSLAPVQICLVVTFVTVIGAFLEMVREGRHRKARQERVRFLRPTPPAVSRTYTVRGLGQWHYQVVTIGEDEF